MKKIILIADIVSSRKITQRASFQKNLKDLFNKINKGSKSIISPLTITLGDEFQAVYKSPGGLFKDLSQMLQVLHPERARFSIGIGEISTRINRQQAIGMDGPAFHLARKGLEEIKSTGRLFIISGAEDRSAFLMENSLNLISHLIYNWKESRYRILNMLYDGVPVKDISKFMKMTEQAVYKNIDAGALNEIVRTTLKIEKIIDNNLKEK